MTFNKFFDNGKVKRLNLLFYYSMPKDTGIKIGEYGNIPISESLSVDYGPYFNHIPFNNKVISHKFSLFIFQFY